MLIRVLAIALGACASSTGFAQVKSRLAIGAVLPLSGPMAAFGTELLRGAELAITQLKQSDPDLAGRIDLFIEDSQSQAKVAETATRKLVAMRRADVLFGSVTSSASYVLGKIAGEAQKPLVAPAAGSVGITKLNDFVFRSCASDDDQGKAMARFATSLGKKKIAAVLERGSLTATAIAAQVEKAILAQGGTFERREYDAGTADFKALVRALKKSDPEILIVPAYVTDAVRIIEAAKSEGLRATMLGSDGWDSPKLTAISNKAALKGSYFLTQFSVQDQSPETVAFIAAYKGQHGIDPGLIAAQGYDGILVIADAFKRAKSSLPSALVKALSSTQGVMGAVGPITIDVTRGATRVWSAMQTTPQGPKFFQRVAVND